MKKIVISFIAVVFLYSCDNDFITIKNPFKKSEETKITNPEPIKEFKLYENMSFRCDGLTYDQVMDGYDPTQYNDIQSLRVDTDDEYVMWKGRKLVLDYYGLKTKVSSFYQGPNLTATINLDRYTGILDEMIIYQGVRGPGNGKPVFLTYQCKQTSGVW